MKYRFYTMWLYIKAFIWKIEVYLRLIDVFLYSGLLYLFIFVVPENKIKGDNEIRTGDWIIHSGCLFFQFKLLKKCVLYEIQNPDIICHASFFIRFLLLKTRIQMFIYLFILINLQWPQWLCLLVLINSNKSCLYLNMFIWLKSVVSDILLWPQFTLVPFKFSLESVWIVPFWYPVAKKRKPNVSWIPFCVKYVITCRPLFKILSQIYVTLFEHEYAFKVSLWKN